MILKGIVTTSTCSSVISTNTTYIRNPGYPSSYTPSSAGTCSYTINKVSTAWIDIRFVFEQWIEWINWNSSHQRGYLYGLQLISWYMSTFMYGETKQNYVIMLVHLNTFPLRCLMMFVSWDWILRQWLASTPALMGPVAWMTLMYLARLEVTLRPSVEQTLDTIVRKWCEMKKSIVQF